MLDYWEKLIAVAGFALLVWWVVVLTVMAIALTGQIL